MSVIDRTDLRDAVLGIPGVAEADVRPDRRADGAGTLRLGYSPDANRAEVALAVGRLLRERFRLSVDPERLGSADPMTQSRLVPLADMVGRDGRAPDAVDGQHPQPGVDGAVDGAVDRPAKGPVDGQVDGASTLSFDPRRVPPATIADQVPAAEPTSTAEVRDEPEATPSTPSAPPPLSPPPPPPVPSSVSPQTLNPAAGQPGAEPATTRLTIERIDVDLAVVSVRATVTLSAGAGTYTGSAEGPASASGMDRCLARATLDAVESALRGPVQLAAEQVDVVAHGSERTVLVVVTLTTPRGSERLAGAAVVRDDMRQAVVRATMDAINRRIGILL